jgi:hypothetical protein
VLVHDYNDKEHLRKAFLVPIEKNCSLHRRKLILMLLSNELHGVLHAGNLLEMVLLSETRKLVYKKSVAVTSRVMQTGLCSF